MSYRFGPIIDSLGVTFRVWAPAQRNIHLMLQDREPAPMERVDDGFFALRISGAGAGTRYKFAVKGNEFPDPASRGQADDANGWSVVRAPFTPVLPDALRPWHEAVLAEVHVGTATPEGTFEALAKKLEHFADAGYTGIELMPVAEFPGDRNWGYDGVLPFAPEHTYGSPEALRKLVDRAHDLDLAVVLDVVYNHFGRKDNFLPLYAPEFFTDRVKTPWGPGVDFNNSIIRSYFCENVQMWLGEYDFDGLRFDAIHEIGTEHADAFLEQIGKTARRIKPNAWLILENIKNCASWLGRDDADRPVDFTAQWNDQVHHALNDLVTTERRGAYKDGKRDPVADIGKALAEGFVSSDDPVPRYNDQPGIAHEVLSPVALVSFVQNHDQIGNRADGERLPARVDARQLDFLHFVLMLSPHTPMFFMGEEGHLTGQFPFFTDLQGKEAEAARLERERQMAEVFNDPAAPGQVPDPSDPATFQIAKLNWEDFAKPKHAKALARFRQLVKWRSRLLWPVSGSRFIKASRRRQGDTVKLTWTFEAGTLTMVLNPSAQDGEISGRVDRPTAITGDIQADSHLALGPWSAAVWMEHAEPEGVPDHSLTRKKEWVDGA